MPTRPAQHTYALTIVTWQRRRILQTDRNAEAVITTLFRHRERGCFHLHAFVVMPDHPHVLLTPATGHSLSRCIQLIKGGASHAIGKPAVGNIWQDGYHEHRIRNAEDYFKQNLYIANNPSSKNSTTFAHVHSSRHYRNSLDPAPGGLPKI